MAHNAIDDRVAILGVGANHGAGRRGTSLRTQATASGPVAPPTAVEATVSYPPAPFLKEGGERQPREATVSGPVAPPTEAGQVLHGLEGLVDAAYSLLPEHSPVKDNVLALNMRSRALAAALGEALPVELREFWEAYSGWFAMFSVGPLIANEAMVREALGEGVREALIVENWRSAGWWSGRELLEPAVADFLAERGVRMKVRPGRALRAVRAGLIGAVARRYGRRSLQAEARAAERARQDGRLAEAEACDALWLSVGASSAELIRQLDPAVRECGAAAQVLDFDYYGSREALARTGLQYNDISVFKTDEVLAGGRGIARRLPGWWKEIEERARGLGVREEFSARQFEAVLERLRVVLWRDGPSWWAHSQAAHLALEAYKPRVVVGFHVYGPVIAPMVIAARRRGIARVCLQHGVIGPRYLGLPCLPWDEKLVFGEYAAEIMRRAREGEMKVTVTGHSLYDQPEEPVQPRPEVLALREGVKGLVVLCTQFNENMFYQPEGWWLAEVAAACRKLGVRLALKLHPSDDEKTLPLYRKLVVEGDDRVVLVPHGTLPLNELLAACDMMITRDSTVVFEANLLGKPVITINLGRWEEELPYAATGGALGVYRLEDIEGAVRSVLEEEGVRVELARKREGFLRAHTGPRDGGATGRIAEVICGYGRG